MLKGLYIYILKYNLHESLRKVDTVNLTKMAL